MPGSRYTIGRLMILIVVIAVICWLALWFPYPLAVVTVFIGPTVGAWKFGWRLNGPYPNALDGAMTGVLIQSLLAGAAAFLVATIFATDGTQSLLEAVQSSAFMGSGVAIFVYVGGLFANEALVFVLKVVKPGSRRRANQGGGEPPLDRVWRNP